MSLKTGTICSKHEEILEIAGEIVGRSGDSDITSRADRIQDLAIACKDDGQRMENGLDEKKLLIRELESELESVKKDLATAEKRIDEMKEEFSDLETELLNHRKI